MSLLLDDGSGFDDGQNERWILPSKTHGKLDADRTTDLEQTLSELVPVSDSAATPDASSVLWYIDDQVCYAFNSRANDVIRATEVDGRHNVINLKRLLLGRWLVGQKEVSTQGNSQARILRRG